MSQQQLLTLGLFACASALVGLLFNGCIVLVLVSNRQMRTANNLLLLHLAFVGILSCVEFLSSTVPFALRTNTNIGVVAPPPPPPPPPPAQSPTTAGHALCVAHGFVFTALLPIVVWTLCGLNCDRYAAIASPLHYSRLVRRKRLVLFVALTWLLGVSLAVPPLFRINRYTHHRDRALCLADFTDTSSGPIYPFAYVTLAIVVPAFLIIFCNVQVLNIARHHRHRIVSAIYEVTVRAQATITHQQNPFYLSKYKGRCAVITIFQLIGSLVALYGPYCGVMFWELFTGTRCPPAWAAIAVLLVAAAAPLNGFVYGLKSHVLRKTFKNFLRKKLYTSEVRQEIQRRGSMSTRGWAATTILSHWHVIPARMQHGHVKSRSESPVSMMRPDLARSRWAAAAGMPRCHSEGVLVRSTTAVQYRLNVPSASPIRSNCRSVEAGFQLLTSLDSCENHSNMMASELDSPLRTGSDVTTVVEPTAKDQLSVPLPVSVPQPPPTPPPPSSVANGHCKSPTISLERFLFQAKRTNLVHGYSFTDRKFSLERLRSGHLKRSLRKVFSPPKLLSERGSI